jgi:hypothetical protein
MAVYELRLADGKVVRMSGRTPEHAAERAADAHQQPVVAWRTDRRPRVEVLGDARRIIG